MIIAWRYDLRPTWSVRLVLRLRGAPVLTGRMVAHRLEGKLLESGRVRRPVVALSRETATVACIVKGVDDIEARDVALAHLHRAAAQVGSLDLGELTYSAASLDLPPTIADGPG